MNTAIQHTAIHPDGRLPITRICRAPEDWELTDFDFSVEDDSEGLGVCTYERTVGGVLETKVVIRQHPMGRRHVGWQWHDGSRTVGHDASGRPVRGRQLYL